MENQVEPQPVPQNGAFLQLGVVLGRHEAFSNMAGRCTAAEAASLHKIRTEKLYRCRASEWEEFCSLHLKISKAHADRLIRLWEEFGAGYFEVAQLTRISPATYRAIAPKVINGYLRFNGALIELKADNAREVAAAVAQLRDEHRDPAQQLNHRLSALERKCSAVISEFEDFLTVSLSGESQARVLNLLRDTAASLSSLVSDVQTEPRPEGGDVGDTIKPDASETRPLSQ